MRFQGSGSVLALSLGVLAFGLCALSLGGCDSDSGGSSAADVAGGDTVAGLSVTVKLGDQAVAVDLTTLATVDVAGSPRVTVAAIVAAALPSETVDALQADDLVAGDGFRSSSRGNCAPPVLPVLGSVFAQGYVDPATRDLSWDDALGYPGCLSVNDLAEIELSKP